ncbi:UBX domain-containing protein [Rutstroemia sp. NJR-2017a BBW]|nr:UBX domain-containing protein [Rutstroemia sp. NJR-2017a BBW]
MASNVVVIDKAFNRATIKVTPGTYMSEVVSEACRKLGKKSTNYDLKRSNDKAVDLSQTFRQTGLTTGAKLSLVEASKSPAPVSIALQLPQELASAVPGGRLTDKFPSNTTLWLILRKFESSSGANLNFTARGVAQVQNGSTGAGRMFYEMPVLNVMGRELATFGDLQKTLANLGLNKGNGLIRLTFRPTDQPIEEAMQVIGEYFQEEEKEPVPGPAQKAVEPVTEAISKVASPEQTDNDVEMDLSPPSGPSQNNGTTPTGLPSSTPTPSDPTSTDQSILGPDGQPLTIFSAPSSTTPRAALAPDNDEDYIPTIRHAKLAQSRLAQGTQNTKLLSYEEEQALEAEKVAKLTKIKTVTLRIRFPDQMQVSRSITSESTAASLYTYVRSLIAAEDQPFKLIWHNKGPETIPNDEGKLLIKHLGIVGPTIVNLNWAEGVSEQVRKAPVLKEVYREKAKEQPVPVVPSVDNGEDDAVPKETAPKKDEDGAEKKKKGLSNLIMKNLRKK